MGNTLAVTPLLCSLSMANAFMGGYGGFGVGGIGGHSTTVVQEQRQHHVPMMTMPVVKGFGGYGMMSGGLGGYGLGGGFGGYGGYGLGGGYGGIGMGGFGGYGMGG